MATSRSQMSRELLDSGNTRKAMRVPETSKEATGRMAGGGNWIAGATENKGGLHRSLGIPEGQKIPKSEIASAAKESGKTGKEARLAQTLEKMH